MKSTCIEDILKLTDELDKEPEEKFRYVIANEIAKKCSEEYKQTSKGKARK